METIAYIGDFQCSTMSAEVQLVLGNAAIFKELGYKVVFIGNEFEDKEFNSIMDTHKTFLGYDLFNVPFYRGSKDIKKLNFIEKEIEFVLKKYNCRFVICYGTPTFSGLLFMLKRWCRKSKIPFIINCVDLPNVSHGSFLQRKIKRVDRILRHWIYKNSDGIIAVSSKIAEYLLDNKYKPSIIVPPVKNLEAYRKPILEERNFIKLVYGGNPFPSDGRKVSVDGYKDRLDIAIYYVDKLVDLGYKIRFDIYGLTLEQYINVVPEQYALLQKNIEHIKFHGRVAKNICEQAFSDSDYMILLRKKNLMTDAGFPTKFVESISVGTPVLITDVGDIHCYLKENINGFFVDIEDEAKGIEQMSKAIELPLEKINIMKKQCYDSKLFDYKKYVLNMQKFLEEIYNKV
ncbi:glycosyltransferase [Clostridium sp.]|uniref:glycosyltransferase n=1 Tax=Clostridium sp. TaxID=1506 RepID=UPI002903623B|nr:glycosyltransferase [Clostridium sp.]MDU1032956.1 glycosyltransferase [Clostridium sp.]MDU4725640.1 glycosyltransferase [Clostridium sp.]